MTKHEYKRHHTHIDTGDHTHHEEEHEGCACEAFNTPKHDGCACDAFSASGASCGCESHTTHPTTEAARIRKDGIRILVALMLYIPAFIIPWDTLFPNHALITKFLWLAIPYIIVGYDVITRAIHSIVKRELLSEAFLMTIATLGAFALVLFPSGGEHMKEAVAIMLFYQVGEWFEHVAVTRSKASISALINLTPKLVNRLIGDAEYIVDTDELQPGDIIQIKPGERVAVDGVLLSDYANIDTSALTGEHIPRILYKNDEISAGSIALDTPLRIQATRAVNDSAISRILHMVENSSARKAETENLIRRFAKVYTPIVTIAALIVALGGSLAFGDIPIWIERALTFLVVSCPCAFVVSVPLTFFAGIGGASRSGILVKGGNYLETLANANTITFDKTGTLSTGEFKIAHIKPHNISEDELLHIAGSIEKHSSHPLAKHITHKHTTLHDDSGTVCKTHAENIQEIPGKGMKAHIEDADVVVGNEDLLQDHDIAIVPCDCTGSVTHVGSNNVYHGHISFEEDIRPQAAEVVKTLKHMGVSHIALLTGDGMAPARRIAHEVSIDAVHAELSPEGKVSCVQAYQHNGETVAFVGDGINDAPALAQADVGIALGGFASDAALEAADIVFVEDSLEKLPVAVRIARKTTRIAKENIALALGIKIGIMVLSVIGLGNLWLAVFGDVGVTIIAIVNALRAFTITHKVI